ncbi:hypothetical protein HW132_12735 [Brasilonema sp. CT11]|nr:hypothetical protein [Brasilonema sp. CT11]
MNLRWRTALNTILGLTGSIAIFCGTISIIVGTSATLIIWCGQKLKPQEETFAWVQASGMIIVLLGVTCTGINLSIIRYFSARQQRLLQEQKTIPLIPFSCKGCRNYHGQRYGQHFLVCGIHPYGVPEGESYCPDFEAIRNNLYS